jgi:transcriptional regulator with XRE-family HTH domain
MLPLNEDARQRQTFALLSPQLGGFGRPLFLTAPREVRSMGPPRLPQSRASPGPGLAVPLAPTLDNGWDSRNPEKPRDWLHDILADVTRAWGKPKMARGRPQIQDIDRYVGARIRERRILLGLTQQQMGELIGVTYQQAHKYEKGINRIAAGRLFTIAQALGVDVGYFVEGMDSERTFKPSKHHRLLFEFVRAFTGIADSRQQSALCNLARALPRAGRCSCRRHTRRRRSACR